MKVTSQLEKIEKGLADIRQLLTSYPTSLLDKAEISFISGCPRLTVCLANKHNEESREWCRNHREGHWDKELNHSAKSYTYIGLLCNVEVRFVAIEDAPLPENRIPAFPEDPVQEKVMAEGAEHLAKDEHMALTGQEIATMAKETLIAANKAFQAGMQATK